MAIIDCDSSTEDLGSEIADAARELATRINLGEFDDLDEGPMMDLRSLSNMMEHWATVAQALQERLTLTRDTRSGPDGTRLAAIRN